MHKGAVFILVMEILKREPFFIDCLSNRDFMASVKYRQCTLHHCICQEGVCANLHKLYIFICVFCVYYMYRIKVEIMTPNVPGTPPS